MSLLALASPELCAAALREEPPGAPEDAVRVILEGSAAMGLTVVCGPWDHHAEVDGVRASLGLPAAVAAETLEGADTVTGWLVGSPGAPPVAAPVSGPLWLAVEARRREPADPQEVLDAAADLVADRVHRLCELRVAHLVVLEASGDRTVDPAAAVEAHTPVARLAHHYGVAVTLVALDDEVPAASLGYERWTTPTTGSDGLVLVRGVSLRDGRSRHVEREARELVTDYLAPGVEPAWVRDVAACAGGR